MTSTIRILCSRSVGLIWLFLFIFWCLVFLHFLWKNILFLDILGILCDVNIRNMISLLVVMLTSALASLLLSVLLFITTLMFSLVTAWGAEGRTFTDSSFMFSFFYWKHNFTFLFLSVFVNLNKMFLDLKQKNISKWWDVKCLFLKCFLRWSWLEFTAHTLFFVLVHVKNWQR